MPNVAHSLPDCISQALLAVTGAGLRWKSLKKQESVQAGATWRSNMSLSVGRSELQESLLGHLHISKMVNLSHETSAASSSYSASP